MAYGPISVALLCGLAFLLACTPARNSDLWLHLASGRWLSAGRLPDGTDPFSSATQGVYWVHSTWLSDILLYQIYKLSNGSAVVVVKAVLMALLAGLLMCFRRRGEGAGVLTLAGLAAVLALGPWMLLQSALLSLLGVVLTLYLLERPALFEGVAAQRAWTQRWLLVPLFALWANLDAWFVLGPVLVGLYALGELLRPSSPSLKRKRRTAFAYASGSDILLFCAGLIACLATPHYYALFAWPTPLGMTHTEQVLRHDPLGQSLVLSPFAAQFVASPVFRSPGAWAYYLLLTASGVSFLLSMRTLHPGRLLVWLTLAALSIYQARTIPFFAVAAAPLLALNMQDWALNRPAPLPSLTLPARRLGVLAGIVLLLLAWPGWLQPAPYQPRSWVVEKDGSLVRMAEHLKRLHAEGRFRPDRFALTFSPDVAHYLAWFCPEEKGFVDSRWPLFDGVADDYVRMRRCLLQESDDSGPELASLFDAHRLDRIVLYDPNWERMKRAYRQLFLAVGPASRRSAGWELLAVEGGAALFRRGAETLPSPEAFNSRRAAYHPALDRRAPATPLRPPQPPRWFDGFLPNDRRDAGPTGSADREEAALHLLSCDLQVERFRVPWILAQAVALIGCGSGPDPSATATTLAVRFQFTPPLPPSAPEPLLLAVRAARRALAVNPDDARAFLHLGEAYFQLARNTRERRWQTMLPDFAIVRQIQTLTALEQAVLLQPDLDPAHELLAQLYVETNQLDRCLDHLRARLRIAEKSGKKTSFVAALRADVEQMEKLVNQSEKTYQANLAGKTDPSKVLDRAQLAVSWGLSRKALEMMKESSPAIFAIRGVEYQVDLMMKAGQSYEVRDQLGPEYEAQIGLYHWVMACAAASCGDYAEADAELDSDSERFRRLPRVLVPVRSALASHVAGAVLTRPLSAIYFQPPTVMSLWMAADLLRQEADRQVLRGLLALEAGEVEAAEQHFRAAVNTWGSDAAAAAGAGLDFPARPLAQEMLRRLQE